MFDEWRFKFKLRKLQKGKRRIDALFQIEMMRARSAEEKAKIRSSREIEITLTMDEMEILQSNFLRGQAQYYLLPRPVFDKDNGDWEESHLLGEWFLSEEGRQKLLASIRKEKKERTEMWLRFGPLITGLTGLVGAAIGFASLFLKFG